MARRTSLLRHAAFHVVVLAAAVALGSTYPRRLSSPGGFHLIAVDDAGARAPFQRPAQAVVAVIDGLGVEEARPMRTVARLAARGRCFETAVGSPSISRPMYAVLSSGVEQDRTGVRSNTGSAPAAVRSVWEDARAAGWRVRVVSSIDWWNELFPRGFDEHVTVDDQADAFAAVRPGVLNLIHVLNIDDAGHAHGAASPEYAAAVARVDGELGRLLDATDLDTSLFVLTADHGHSLRGGHGGLAPRVATVMTCFAGRNVQPGAGPGTLRATAIAPAIALLTGVPFPRHMRAGDDDLDAALSLVRADGGNAAYLADRREAVARFRARDRAELGGTWDQLYASRRARQRWLGAGVAALLLGLVVLAAGRRVPVAAAALATVALMVVGVVADRGSFDLSAVNSRPTFIAHVALLCAVVALAGALAFARLRRDANEGLRLLTPVAVALLGATMGQTVVYGFVIGFPLPPPALLFLPLFSTVAAGATAGIGLLTCAWLALRASR